MRLRLFPHAREQLFGRPCNACRRLLEAFTVRVLAYCQQEFAHGMFEALLVDLSKALIVELASIGVLGAGQMCRLECRRFPHASALALSAASIVCSARIAQVTAPTPPGTGVSAPTTSFASSATSPTKRPSEER